MFKDEERKKIVAALVYYETVMEVNKNRSDDEIDVLQYIYKYEVAKDKYLCDVYIDAKHKGFIFDEEIDSIFLRNAAK